MKEQRLCDLCDTFLFSESKDAQRRNAKRYVSGKLGYPDEGSEFDKELGKAKHLFRIPGVNGIITSAGLWYLQRQGYDSLMLDLTEEIIGHTAFQVHQDNSLHVFSVEVLPQHQGEGLARYMIEETLKEARKKGIERMRIGGGGHASTNRIHANFSQREEELKISAQDENWVNLQY